MDRRRVDLRCVSCTQPNSATGGRGLELGDERLATALLEQAWGLRWVLGTIAHGLGPVRLNAQIHAVPLELGWFAAHARHKGRVIRL